MTTARKEGVAPTFHTNLSIRSTLKYDTSKYYTNTNSFKTVRNGGKYFSYLKLIEKT